MFLRRLALTLAFCFGIGGVAAAAPASTAEPLAADTLAVVDYAKKGGKHGKHHGWHKRHKHHGWRGRGHRYGWYKQRRHYGAHRGRHLGWYKHRRHHGRHARRVYFRF